MKTRLVTALLAALSLCGCVHTTILPSFLSDDTVRLEIDGAPVFTYDKVSCQLSFNEQRGHMGAMTDTMLDFFCVTLDHIPQNVGEKARASISWTTPEGEKSINEVTLETKRIKGDILWLCDEAQRTAAVVRVLN